MAIARTARPELIVSGTVRQITARIGKTGTVYKNDVTFTDDTGAVLVVEYWEREDNSPTLPETGSRAAIVAQLSESQKWGASLSFAREVGAADLALLTDLVGAERVKRS